VNSRLFVNESQSATNIKNTTLSMPFIDAVEYNNARVRSCLTSKNRQSVTMPDEVRDGDIVGLDSSTKGSSCGSHECYEKHIYVGGKVLSVAS
jgi:hypothetical protein